MTISHHRGTRWRQQATGYRIWISLLLIYNLVLLSSLLTEQDARWMAHWDRAWQAERVEIAGQVTELVRLHLAQVPVPLAIEERQKFTTPWRLDFWRAKE